VHWCFVRATQCNFCSALDFVFLNHASNSPELNALIRRFRESYSSMSMTRKWKRLKKSSSWLDSGNAVIQHLSEKCNFHVSPFCLVVQKHKLFEVAWWTIFLTALLVTFLPKKYQNLFACVKVIASQRWDVCWDAVYLQPVLAGTPVKNWWILLEQFYCLHVLADGN